MTDDMQFDREHLWHPYSSMTKPMEMLKVAYANGNRITLDDGRELIDGMASWWSAIHGYNHPVLNDAVCSQIGEMSHVMFGGLTHQPAIDLGKTLLDIVPAGLDKIFYSDSGSVAVEVAIKMALQYWHSKGKPEKSQLLSFMNAYHGDTFGAMSVTDPVNGMHSLFSDVLPKHHFATSPATCFGEECKDEDLDCISKILQQHAATIAAVIIEPIVQGAGGMRIYSADYLLKLKKLCEKNGVLLIADEIATGFGRTGELFACNHAGITPDIMCLGKAITGGYLSFAATLCTADIANGISNGAAGVFMHGPTFMANPLACHVANSSIQLLLSQDWKSNINRIEEQIKKGLEPAKQINGVKEVRVIGAIGVIEMEAPVDINVLQPMLVEQGVWVRPFGKLVYIMPPYITSDSDLIELTSKILMSISSYLRKAG